MQRARHDRLAGLTLILLRHPMDFGHPSAVRERLAVAGNTRLVGLDHRWIPEYDCDLVSVMAGADNLPVFVSAEVRKGETAGYLQRIPVLGRQRKGAEPGRIRCTDLPEP